MSPPLDRLPTVPCSSAAAPRQHAVRRNSLSSVQLLLLHGSESRRSARHSSQSPLCLNHQGLDLLLEPLQVLDDVAKNGSLVRLAKRKQSRAHLLQARNHCGQRYHWLSLSLVASSRP
ncbi:hypothetical protein OPV22_006023 [Ensete ventricosum]|uniref:Uncharacterized protein n=1 Tax=Ensete ventricosum TaxID=4639 RepID=A0AAV8Q312_ENSVE|nr:hypothetical protein OPV22_006023 [Ensete ventricosum]